jgi:ribonuclease PH
MTSPSGRQRPDGRAFDALRKVEMVPGFHRNAEGSVLYRAGGTVVLCTASVDPKVPPFLEGKGKGWITAEYQMHPRSSPARREARDGRGKAPGGRTLEIQRLVGRALRAAVALDRLGERTITIDCDVLEADGGTRTASVTGGFVALALALSKLASGGVLAEPVLRDPVAATSVGYFDDGTLALDLEYTEDSTAGVDLNIVATGGGAIVEVQGTAEGAPVSRPTIDSMVDLALRGVAELARLQRAVLARAGVELGRLQEAARAKEQTP